MSLTLVRRNAASLVSPSPRLCVGTATAFTLLLMTALTLPMLAQTSSEAPIHLQSLQVLHHHVRPAVSSRRAALVGSLPPEQRLKLSIVLPLRNQGELTSLLSGLYDPSSPNYHHFLSVDQFTERFGPTAEDYQATVDFAKANGLAVVGVPANRMLVPVRGSVAQIEKAFHLSMRVYQHPTENRTFYSPDREPLLDLEVPVAHIAGLNNFSTPHPLVKKASAEQTLSNPAVLGSGPGGSYLASDMRAVYYGAGALTGSGQTVGLVEFDGYNISDVTSSFNGTATSSTNGSNYVLAYTPTAGGGTYHVPVNNVLLDGAGVASVSGDDSEEVLDIVQAIGMAPGLNQVRVYIGSNDVDILNAMAEENIAKQLSISWAREPDDPSTDDFIFQEFAAQGQSVFAASGDDGAFNPLDDYFFPGEDAWVTAVGGTNLITHGAGGGRSSETAWTYSGGGISPDGIPIPSWQEGVADSSNGGSTTLRNVPDVAAEADFDNYDCNMGVCQGGWGGTSFAAPRWAGFMALVNQQAVAANNPAVGFINPLLYSIGESSSYNRDFYDITSGNNGTTLDLASAPIIFAGFNAVSGYDLVTGWGSPTGQNLIDALAPTASGGFQLSASPSSLTINPGASAATTITVHDIGGFTGNVSLAVSGVPSGVTASFASNPTTGTSVLTLTVSSSAIRGSYLVTITGTSGTVTATTTLALAVNAPGFSISPLSGTMYMNSGTSSTATIVVTDYAGFAGNVSLAVTSGLPSGIVASWAGNPTSASGVLTLTASNSTAPGVAMVTITGTSGALTATTTLPLTIQGPEFNLNVSPFPYTIAQGSAVTATVTVVPLGNFTGSVTLSAPTLPPGVTATFNPNPTSGSSVLTMTAGGTAPLGTSSVWISGASTYTGSSVGFKETITAAPTPTFAVGVSPAGLTLTPGASVTDTITVTKLNGFTGSVTLTAHPPSGVTASFDTNPTSGTSVLTLTASSAVAPTGFYPMGIVGTSGAQTVSASIYLAVNPAPPVVTVTQSSANFGTVAVGASTGSTQTLSFAVPSNLMLGSISAVTQGAPNLDFTVVSGGTTCANGTTAAGCTVEVQFLPTAPGTRMGAVVLADQVGNTLVTVPVFGTGTGPIVAFGPGIITTVAGTGIPGYNGDNVPAISTELNNPWGVVVDSSGNLYIADYINHRIRKVTPGGIILSVAGNGTQGYNGDNIAATSAELNYPAGVAVDGAGNLYIADTGNNRIRKMTPGGTITTVAGTGTTGYSGDNIAATSATLSSPYGVAVDGAGNLYIADYGNNRIRKVTPSGTITTVAGNGTYGYSGDGGPAISAELFVTLGVAVDASGNLYIADFGNHRIRMVTPGGIITTVAGNGTPGYNGDNITATSAELYYPYGVAVDGTGNLYIADNYNHRIRKVTPGGIITTVAGNGTAGYNGDNIAATSAELLYPTGVAVDASGNLYVADHANGRIRKVDVSDPPSLTYASTAVGSVSAAQDVTVLNLGNAPLNISQISTAANFSLGGSDTSCSSSSQTLAPAASCVLGIEFTPASAGSINGSVVLTDSALNAGAAMQTIALQGTGLQASQTITFPNPGAKTYGVAPITLTATASSGLAVSYTVTSGPATVSGSTLTITGAGSVTVQATQVGNGNYTAATLVNVTFAVNPAALTAVANSTSVVFGASIPTLTGTLTGVVTGDSITASYATTAIQGSAVGTYPITPTLNDPNGKLSNYSVTKTAGTLTITTPPVVTATQSSVNFGSVAIGASTGTTQTLSFTVPSGITLGGVSAVTQGAPNLDFTVVTGGTTCTTGTTATTCTVQVQFLATAPGTRLGGVVMSDQSGGTLITVPAYGVGIGPMVAFGPSIITTVAGTGTVGYNGDNIAATSAQLADPFGVAADGAGNLYMVDRDNNRIRKVTQDGIITTVAGNGNNGYNGDNIAATSAELSYPNGVTVDGAGNLYIADYQRVRKVTPGGTITTVAGNGTAGYNGDNIAATSAELYYPNGIAVDFSGNLYIADAGNSRIRKVTPGGIITTVAGNGNNGYNGDNIAATSAELNPSGVAVDGAGNLYIADIGNSRIRKVMPTGIITTVAGNGNQGYSGDNGAATSAELTYPNGVALDGVDNLYIADTNNQRVRKVTPGGIITTVAGNGTQSYDGDNIAATGAGLANPFGVAVDGAGNLYIADGDNNRIRKVDVSNAPSLTFASTNVGAASAMQDVNVLNLGNAPLTISSISTAANFSLGGSDTSCSSSSQTLAPAASCVLGIEFTPASAGSINGSVVLTDNALNAGAAIQTIALQGTGLQQSQTINFPNPGTKTYGVDPITLTATASSALGVSYTVTSGPATVSGNTLTITGAGSVTLQGSQGGNSNYTAATPVSVTFTVNPAALTVAANNVSVAYGDPIPTLTGTLTGVVAGDGITASYTTTATQGSAVGTYPITPTLNDPNGKLSNYSVTKTSGTLMITATTVVTTTQSSVNFGAVAVGASAGTTQTLSFTVPSSVTLGSVSAVTQGAPNLDFTVVPGGTTCASGTTATTCSVQVQFLAKAPGTRLGGVVLSDQNGNTLITVPAYGTGTGPMVAFGPGIITTVAGTGNCAVLDASGLCFNGDNIPAISAELVLPTGVAVDGAGDIYIADGNGRIRKITPAGTITTVAGGGGGCTGQTDDTGDGCAATSAELSPNRIAVDGAGNLYIVELANNRIRKVTPGGTITTVAGTGTPGYNGDNIAATSAELNYPLGIAVDGAGNLFIAEKGNSRIRKVTPGGIITTVAGTGTPGYNGDNIAATSAELGYPFDVAVDGAGNLYIADYNNSRIRKVAPGGTITTVAGNGVVGYNGDNIAATDAELYDPSGIAVDGAGNLYIADLWGNRIRKVTPDGTITTVAGIGYFQCGFSGEGAVPTSAELCNPEGIALDGSGNLFIADVNNNRVRKVNVSDAPSLTFAGTNVGQASASQDVTVLNLGNAPLTISQIGTSANFSLGGSDTSCSSTGQTLAPAASCVLGIEFNPTANGSLSGSVALSDNASNAVSATQTISMAGAGTSLAPQSQTISFPNPGTHSYGVSITLTASASSGLPVSYSVTSGPATVSGSTLNTSGTGSVTVQAAQTGNTSYSAATPVSVTFTVAQAPLTITPSSYSRVVGAANPILTGTVVGVENNDLNAGNLVITYSTTATTSSPTGTYPITASISGAASANYVLTVNPGILGVGVTVGVDLIESGVSVTGTPASGGTIQVAETAINQGTQNATASYTYLYLSSDGITKGTTLSTRYVGALAAGAGSTATTSLTLPTNITGTNYVLACANGNNGVVESNTANNCTASAAFTVAGADLIVSSVTGPVSGIAGGAISVTDTTNNQGGGAATASYTYFYLSTDGKTKGTQLGNRNAGALAAGAGSTATTSLTLPTNITGTNYVLACANGNNGVVESNTANNCTASAAFTITH